MPLHVPESGGKADGGGEINRNHPWRLEYVGYAPHPPLSTIPRLPNLPGKEGKGERGPRVQGLKDPGPPRLPQGPRGCRESQRARNSSGAAHSHGILELCPGGWLLGVISPMRSL